MKAEKRTSTSGPYLEARDWGAWRRERFERQLASGELTIRYVCPRCGGSHHIRDCPFVIDRKAA